MRTSIYKVAGHQFFIWALLLSSHWGYGQSYTSYFTGNLDDKIAQPLGGICLMGGSKESDEAMRWFLKRADGGDVLVLRASGSDGYNSYMFERLGVPVNSVESIVFHNDSASRDEYVLRKIQQAEAIWIAGGNQSKYVAFWRNTAVDSLINIGIKKRSIVIGGTSAGMAIMGGFYFSARNGSVTSEVALSNPYHEKVVADSMRFIQNEILQDVVTDTHYANRERQGRHVTFLARILVDYGIKAKGIACDERIAVCIDPDGSSKIYGDYPQSENKAYFIQISNELPESSPENCSPNQALDWKNEGKALEVYAVYGTPTGENSFDLMDWQKGRGGSWENWFVDKGELKIVPQSHK